jgi:hypothetical protein
MKIKLIFSALAGAIVLGSADAGTVLATNINTAEGDTVITSSSGALIDGGVVAVGYFLSTFDVAAAVAANDYDALISNFVTINSSFVGETTVDFGVDLAGYYTLSSFDYGAPSVESLGRILYTFFGDGITLGSSTEIGLVEFSEVIDSDNPTPDSNRLRLFTEQTGGEWTVLIGATGTSVTVDLTSVGLGIVETPSFVLQTIPETSTAILGAFGALGLLRRRR